MKNDSVQNKLKQVNDLVDQKDFYDEKKKNDQLSHAERVVNIIDDDNKIYKSKLKREKLKNRFMGTLVNYKIGSKERAIKGNIQKLERINKNIELLNNEANERSTFLIDKEKSIDDQILRIGELKTDIVKIKKKIQSSVNDFNLKQKVYKKNRSDEQEIKDEIFNLRADYEKNLKELGTINKSLEWQSAFLREKTGEKQEIEDNIKNDKIQTLENQKKLDSTKNQIGDLSKQIEGRREEYLVVKDKFQEKAEKLLSIEKGLKEKNEYIEKLRDQELKTREKIQVVQDKIGTYQNEIINLDSETRELKFKIRDIEKETDRVGSKVNSLTSILSEKQYYKKSRQKQYGVVLSSHENLKTRYDKLEKDIVQNENEIADLDKLKEEINKKNRDYSLKMSQLQSDLLAMTDDIENKREDFEALFQEVQEKEAKTLELEIKVEEKNKISLKLEKRVEQESLINNEHTAKQTRLKEITNKRDDEIHRLEKRLVQLQSSNDKVEFENNELSLNISKLKEEMEEKESRIEGLEANIKTLEMDNKEKRKHLCILEKTVKEINQKNIESAKLLEALNISKSELDKAHQQAYGHKDILQVNSKKLIESLKQLTEERNQKESSIEVIEKDINRLESDNNDQEESLNVLRANVSDINLKNEMNVKTLEDLIENKNKLNQINLKLSEEKEKLDKNKKELTESIEQLIVQKEPVEKSISDLQNKRELLSVENERNQKKFKKLEHDVAEKIRNNIEYTGMLEQLKKQKVEIDESLNTLGQENIELEGNNRELSSAINNLSKDRSKKQTSIGITQKNIESTRSQIIIRKDSLSLLGSKLNDQNIQIKEMSVMLDQLNVDKTMLDQQTENIKNSLSLAEDKKDMLEINSNEKKEYKKEIKNKIIKLEGKQDKLEKDKQFLTDKIGAITSDTHLLEKECGENSLEVDRLENNAKELQNRYEDRVNHKNKIDIRLLDLQRKLEKSISERDNINSKLNKVTSLVSYNEDLEQSAKKQLDSLREEMSESKSNIERYNARIDVYEQNTRQTLLETESAKKELMEYKSKVSQRESSLKLLEGLMSTRKNEASMINKRLEDIVPTSKKLELDESTMKSEIDEIENGLNSLLGTYEKRREEITVKQNKVEVLTKKNLGKMTKLQGMEDELIHLDGQINFFESEFDVQSKRESFLEKQFFKIQDELSDRRNRFSKLEKMLTSKTSSGEKIKHKLKVFRDKFSEIDKFMTEIQFDQGSSEVDNKVESSYLSVVESLNLQYKNISFNVVDLKSKKTIVSEEKTIKEIINTLLDYTDKVGHITFGSVSNTPYMQFECKVKSGGKSLINDIESAIKVAQGSSIFYDSNMSYNDELLSGLLVLYPFDVRNKIKGKKKSSSYLDA